MMAGVINVLKPPGMTSHDVVSFIRRTYGIKRVGHAGTLDPAAAGVLPVFLGAATRLIEYVTDCDKSYRVELTFGYATDTGDDTGTVIAQAPCPALPAERLAAVLRSFLGDSEQIPPMYSAIKVNGKKLYDLARSGVTVERQPRKITITDIQFLTAKDNTLLFDVVCSKGTYIRSLCMDIGEKVGCPAVMSFLVRTRVGQFSLQEALTVEEVGQDKERALQPVDSALQHMPLLRLTAAQAQAFRYGQSIACVSSETLPMRIYNEQGLLIGIGQGKDNSLLVPVKVFSDDIR
ncbi:tRNA pseudouridine(55) synthase TruB [Propionispora vibrioides]|uniref:tRNA pseudouridine synthase B n=1 Tax=Propionispora vibrioides TaxID=112903 RepID=A0A1H8SMW7_9FIRM|nr:tRNA pseudouridine(55) synthase TruB [Propionispora vibrioides]SEO79856.1 tRNA pseudouridine55 synthase [Propionispora vibrioides]